jgi:hypothetical protein
MTQFLPSRGSELPANLRGQNVSPISSMLLMRQSNQSRNSDAVAKNRGVTVIFILPI